MILGSKSPRRQELLKLICNDFEVKTIDVDESVDVYSSVKEYANKIATKKINAYVNYFGKDEIIICADTIVALGDTILEKPKNKEHCYQMIKNLQNNFHIVYTTVAISYYGKIKKFMEKTIVYVDEMTESEINEYIQTEEPYDKAGGYGIQGIFSKYISKISGDYYNVMGLPVSRLFKELKKLKKASSN